MIHTTLAQQGIEYRESTKLTNLGGFLMARGNRRRVTLSAQLTDDEKRRGLVYLLDKLAEASEQTGIYLWMSESEPAYS